MKQSLAGANMPIAVRPSARIDGVIAVQQLGSQGTAHAMILAERAAGLAAAAKLAEARSILRSGALAAGRIGVN
ncbi:hypothetical protein GPL17_36450 [Bradyrhizobium yuanmingense]|uniref:hypothetical protein n=1 Tax=Bradyrhizobium yuanmingense TaxID=108015 RepID=UPI0012FB5147|nr:hypothetical protein [Bradyrhizobium yuanmingense]MVT55888.1 hypothetical protein [Bradyrhizobium yuanmingense]